MIVLGSGVSVISVKSVEQKLKGILRGVKNCESRSNTRQGVKITVCGLVEYKKKSSFKKIFSPAEIRYCEGKRHQAEHFAGRLAAKTACLSALGLKSNETLLAKIEVARKPSGEPILRIHPSLLTIPTHQRVTFHLSMAHERDAAVAFVLMSKLRG